jgi:hypothetical protein
MKELKDLSPPLIVAWFRNQAKRFTDMADYVESTFEVKMPKMSNGATMQPETLNEENILRAVKKRGHRVGDLARRFNVTPTEVEEIINVPDSKLQIGFAGWVQAKK